MKPGSSTPAPSMTKLEAIEAMKRGEKVTHRYFEAEEWVTIHRNGGYQIEDGYIHAPHEFWRYRSHVGWETDWAIWSPAPEVAATSDSEKCTQCDGYGEIKPDVTCKHCEGTGKVEPVSGVAAPTGGSEAKHTPGPWRLKERDADNDYLIKTDDGMIVAEVFISGAGRWADEEYANAELIARAPETARELAALKALLREVRDYLTDATIIRRPGTMPMSLAEKLDRALEGEKTATKD